MFLVFTCSLLTHQLLTLSTHSTLPSLWTSQSSLKNPKYSLKFTIFARDSFFSELPSPNLLNSVLLHFIHFSAETLSFQNGRVWSLKLTKAFSFFIFLHGICHYPGLHGPCTYLFSAFPIGIRAPQEQGLCRFSIAESSVPPFPEQTVQVHDRHDFSCSYKSSMDHKISVLEMTSGLFWWKELSKGLCFCHHQSRVSLVQ